MNQLGQYLPDLGSAKNSSAYYLDSYNLPWTVKEYPARQFAAYRNERSRVLLATIDQVLITPDDLREAGIDTEGFNFIDGFAEAYFFNPWYRK